MDDQRPFLRFKYHIGDLSTDIGIPIWQLSLFLNREIGLNFNAFINHYRVWHCERLIQNGDATRENIDSLAVHCGFSNRISLYMAFKKFTGFTPSRYKKAWTRFLNEDSVEH
jgi:AraC-like DNA-binding protein